MAWGQPVRIDYEDFEELKEKELKDSKTMMRDPYIKGIPAGGRIIVNIKDVTLAGANTKYYSVRVEDPQGKIIVEEKGRIFSLSSRCRAKIKLIFPNIG
jgi:hypothetical protein